MKTNKKIYIDLDSLFDTRLGCIAELNPTLVLIALQQNYLERKTDQFSFLKDETFRSLYQFRNIETLRVSPFTCCHKVLASACVNMLKGSIDGPEITSVNVVVNTFPFKLSDKETGDLLELIVDKTSSLVQVEIIHRDFKDITFKYCEDNFDILFMYDYLNFIEYNVKQNNHKKNTINDRILIAPEIYQREMSVKDLDKIHRKNPEVSGFGVSDAIKAIASPVVMLEFLEAAVFSVDLDLYNSDFYAFKDTKEETT